MVETHLILQKVIHKNSFKPLVQLLLIIIRAIEILIFILVLEFTPSLSMGGSTTLIKIDIM